MKLTTDRRRWTIAGLALIFLTACPGKGDDPGKGSGSGAGVAVKPAKEDPAVADIVLPTTAEDPARKPTSPKSEPVEVSARYILLQFTGAKNAAAAKRTKADALKRASRLVRVARKKGIDFRVLSEKYSEGPEKSRGLVETFRHGGGTDPAFEKAIFGMGEGQVSNPVATAFGYYVIERVKREQYSTAHILIMYKGAKLAPVALRRSKAAAKKRAELAWSKATKPDASFSIIASSYSDSPSKLRGGVIARIGPGRTPPGLENYLAAVRELKAGQVSSVIETPYGFHVIKRLPLQVIEVSHILVAWRGAAVKPKEQRNKATAQQLALKIRREASAKDADFSALAKKYSDDPAASKGGALPPAARGEMASPKFEQHAFALKPGGLSTIVQTRFGFHLIKRLR
jgi:parvulin-like peptidyl-prolyl isomerase